MTDKLDELLAERNALQRPDYRCERACEAAQHGGTCRCSELFSELPALTAEVDALRAERDRLREALDGLLEECDKTIAWRQAVGMRPATDISVFSATALSGVIATKRVLRAALSGEGGAE